jgi:hypothetical protein
MQSGLGGASPAQHVRLRRQPSGESSADKPTPLAATSSFRLQDALESVCLEQAGRSHIRGSLVDAIAFGVHRVTLNHDCAAGARMLNCASSRSCISPRRRNPDRTLKQTADHASASSTCGMVRELTRARYVPLGAIEQQPATSPSTNARTPGPGGLPCSLSPPWLRLRPPCCRPPRGVRRLHRGISFAWSEQRAKSQPVQARQRSRSRRTGAPPTSATLEWPRR